MDRSATAVLSAPSAALHTVDPWVESPFFEQLLPERGLSPDIEQLARRYHRDGYLVLEGVLSPDDADAMRDEVANLEGPFPPGSDHVRYQDAWLMSPATRALACHSGIMGLLELLYGRGAFPFQTLTFPRGTGQREHADTIHFSSMPARYMCGVWVALEDIEADMGPLFYYPGSHRLPEYNYYDIWQTVGSGDYRAYEDFLIALMAAHGLERHTFCCPKGSALIWAANLVHGGSPVTREDSSRWSQVTHYYFDGCIYYTPMHSDPISGEYLVRAPVDITTGEPRQSTWNGLQVVTVPSAGDRCRISIVDG